MPRMSSFYAPFSGRRTHPRPHDDVKSEINDPTEIFDAWSIGVFLPGLDGEPAPIEYLASHSRAHKISIVDIDAKDTRMIIYVDDVAMGITPDFELNKTIDCGENWQLCLQEGFSAGAIVVPSGKHKVRIEWYGKG